MELTPVVQAERAAGRRSQDLSDVPWDDVVLVRTTAEVRTALREAAEAAAAAAARALSVAELLDKGLTVLTEGQVPSDPPSWLAAFSHRTDSLSPREREVLALVAMGQTNKAIADALYVSPNTVKTHVSSLLHKLRAETRVQLAAIATRHGLA
jgi:two-component system, NarL family, nitrate/nitrite response regulator NarL